MKLGIKDAKFSGYSFYMNPNIWEHFQVCISVPLRKFEAKYLQNIRPLSLIKSYWFLKKVPSSS